MASVFCEILEDAVIPPSLPPAPFAPKGVKKVLRRFAAQFLKCGAKRRNLIPPTPFSEKGVAPQGRGIRACCPSLGVPGSAGRQEWRPLLGAIIRAVPIIRTIPRLRAPSS